MQVKLEFDTSDYDEKIDYELASNGARYHRALIEFSQEVLRKGRKYEYFRGKELTDEEYEFICKLEEDFHQILDEHGVNLDIGG